MTKKAKDPYSHLCKISKEISLYESVAALLGWDQETYLPQDAISVRSEQIELIESHAHRLKTAPKFVKALQKLIDIPTGEIQDSRLSSVQNAALREWRRDYQKMAKLPQSFVRTFAAVRSKAMHVWIQARKNKRFSEFAPHLEKIVKLCRKKADLLGFQQHPYDALLDLYEPEATTAELAQLFSRLRPFLTDLIKKMGEKTQPKRDFLYGDFSLSKQLHFGHELLQAMGFDPLTSRLDLSAHPFCTGLHPKDTRMTTHVHRDYLMSNIFAVIHEGGHGLYNKNLPEEYYGTSLCQSPSLGIDESQSRFWETIIGHSFPFWKHFYPKLQDVFPDQLQGISLEDFYRAINYAAPSLIRIEADEVTYNLHIIVRFEIEKALIEGQLKVKEVPEAWNAKMQEYLGIQPPDDALGCLQDIHWSMGALGYFPTYTLGNLYAAQIFHSFEKRYPDWKEKVQQGDLSFIQTWLKEQIHCHGRRFTPKELILQVTGKPLSEAFFTEYLKKKFETLYGLTQ